MPDTAARIAALVDELASDPDIRELAKPSSLPTTRHDYGGYLSKLVRLAQKTPILDGRPEEIQAKLWAVILMEAGGDRQGIADAVRIKYGFRAGDAPLAKLSS